MSKKKLLAVLLAGMLATGSISVPVFAEDTNADESTTATEQTISTDTVEEGTLLPEQTEETTDAVAPEQTEETTNSEATDTDTTEQTVVVVAQDGGAATTTKAAKIGDVEYGSLTAAITAAGENATITLLDNVTGGVTVGSDKNITLDLNGKNITASGDAIINNGTLIIKDLVGGGEIKSGNLAIVLGNNSNTTIESGIFLAQEFCVATALNTGATITINGGTFTSKDNAVIGGNGKEREGKPNNICVNGGTFNGGITTVGYIACGIYAPWQDNITVTGGTFNITGGAGIVARAGNVKVTGGKFTVTGNTRGCVGDNENIISCSALVFDSGANYPALTADSKITVSGGTFGSDVDNISVVGEDAASRISVEGGTFDSDVSDYVVNGKMATQAGDTWTITNAKAKVIEEAKTTGATITLDNLHINKSVALGSDATYKVVVDNAPQADVEAVNETIKQNQDTNPSKQIFDIAVVKTDSMGSTTRLDGSSGITNQKVTITLGETPKKDSVKIYHVTKDNSGSATATALGGDQVTVNGNKVTFTATSFSTYAVSYDAEDLQENEVTKNIGVAFERQGTTSTYDIVLKAMDSGKINRFMSTDLTFDLTVSEGAVGYTIEPSAHINLIDKGDNRYEFNLDGKTASSATGEGINIGTVTFAGTGKIVFSVKTAGVDTNIVNTAKVANNIVDNYTTAGDVSTTGKLTLNDDVKDTDGSTIIGKIDQEFTQETADLKINVTFPNDVENQKIAYQDMKVTISGGNLTEDKVINLGKSEEATDSDSNVKVTYAEASDTTPAQYTVGVTETLTKNIAYTVKVEGAGYRTARYTVNMTDNKTLNFWNNVKDEATVVETDNDNSKKNVTFLAGDIVKDNQINLYDLSAVVSYFGTDNLVADHTDYAKYDLNRDGRIDSKDIAYVLVSWGK